MAILDRGEYRGREVGAHWKYPHGVDSARARESFAPDLEGARHGLRSEHAVALWDRVTRDATNEAGWCDLPEARARFHALAARLAGRHPQMRPGVGRATRVETEFAPRSRSGDAH
jgi:hypothetical protein